MIFPWTVETWKELQRRVETLPHALLVHGPAGIGKLALAEHFAQRLLCESANPSLAPCGGCDGCRWYQAGNHPDFRRLEPESMARRLEVTEEAEAPATGPAKAAKPSTEIKVEQVRALEPFLNVQSHRGGRRVVLVHPAEDMNPSAANALLKGLEEPPQGAFFLLVSHRPARLLATIRSRCVPLPMAMPARGASEAWLNQQGVKEPGRWLAFASGAPLLALQYSQGAAESLDEVLRLLQARDVDALGAVNDRERLEVLAEVLQKHALDVAFASFCGATRFGGAKPSRDPAAWLRYARKAGRNRALARHPLNPRLFAGEMLAELPKN